MLAKRLLSVLSPMTLNESLVTSKIHSVVGRTILKGGIITPGHFRNPLHVISGVILLKKV